MSVVSIEELRQLESTAGWTDDDAQVLLRHERIFVDRAEAMVDPWRAEIASRPFLAQWFFGPDGRPDEAYKAKVRLRFAQWVRDVSTRAHDREWLDYQEEIGLRHTPARKNATDGAHTPPLVPLRYLVAFISVVTLTARPFFVDAGVSGTELELLEQAWTRAVVLHIALWCRTYAKDGLW